MSAVATDGRRRPGDLTLPRPDIVRCLYEQYYRSAGAAAEGPLISSHWAHMSDQFAVELDPNGMPVVLAGRGFGDLERAPGMSQRTKDALTVLAQFVLVPNRRDVARLIPDALAVCRAARLRFSFETFRQVCALAIILRRAPERLAAPLRVINIGDGYGFLSALIKRLRPDARLVLVDMGKTLLFQATTCQVVHPTVQHALLIGDDGADPANLVRADFIYCPAGCLDDLGDIVFNLAINVVSMQEMNTATIARYFRFLRRHLQPGANLFYCCNREVKVLRGGERTVFDQYPWDRRDQHLVDGYCPWWRYNFSLRPGPVGPRLLGVRVPFVNHYQKLIRHRLTVLAAADDDQRVR